MKFFVSFVVSDLDLDQMQPRIDIRTCILTNWNKFTEIIDWLYNNPVPKHGKKKWINRVFNSVEKIIGNKDLFKLFDKLVKDTECDICNVVYYNDRIKNDFTMLLYFIYDNPSSIARDYDCFWCGSEYTSESD